MRHCTRCRRSSSGARPACLPFSRHPRRTAMFEISAETAAEYLRSTGRAESGEPIEVRELAGGVSNAVLHVIMPGRGEEFVLKQARARLRVKQEWLCPVERI